jgi:hypothetical protein
VFNLMTTLSLFRFILNHPLNRPNRLGGLLRFVKWEFSSRLMYGYNESEIHTILYDYGFATAVYDPKQRKLSKSNYAKGQSENNFVYIRDIEFVQNWLKSAEKVKILGQLI